MCPLYRPPPNNFPGHRNEGVLDSEVPFLAPLMSTSDAYLWNYTTVPQPGLGGRSIPYIRGHILGGSTSISKPALIPVVTSCAQIH